MLPADADRAHPRLTCYAVPQEFTSPHWARAFAKGAGGVVAKLNELQPGDVAMFGSRKRWRILQQAIAEGRTWWYGDHAYFGRREYFRITRNALQHDCRGRGDPQRLEALGVRVTSGWRRDGRHILVCPNTPEYFAMHGLDCNAWVDGVTAQLRLHTDRDIRVRFKWNRRPFEEDLRGAWAVVVFTSVCGLHAAIDGIPCFATVPCASQAFGTGDLSRIEDPVRPDNRFEMAAVLAANQWTLHEMSSGRAWRELNDATR